jgi:hypothetical protein
VRCAGDPVRCLMPGRALRSAPLPTMSASISISSMQHFTRPRGAGSWVAVRVVGLLCFVRWRLRASTSGSERTRKGHSSRWSFGHSCDCFTLSTAARLLMMLVASSALAAVQSMSLAAGSERPLSRDAIGRNPNRPADMPHPKRPLPKYNGHACSCDGCPVDVRSVRASGIRDDGSRERSASKCRSSLTGTSIGVAARI